MESRIRKLRVKAGLNQSELAEKVNVHQTAVSQWETGKSSPDGEILKKLADILHTTTDYLLGREDSQRQHINDDEALEIMEILHKRPEMKILFNAGRKATKEDVLKAVAIVDALRKQAGGED